MTLNEILKANGLDENAVKAITDAMKENKVFTATEENLDVRYGKLKTDNEALNKQFAEAQSLIAELKKSNEGNEGLQTKITDYESQIQKLQADLVQTKLDAAIKVGLLSEKALDVDYLTFKLKEKGELTLDENGRIKGWDDKLSALKTQLPTQFEGTGKKTFVENKLPDERNSGNDGMTKEAFNKMGYADRLKLFNEQPEVYAELNK